jgi:Cyclin, N-terminal domain/Cyclin, C-terminal domain
VHFLFTVVDHFDLNREVVSIAMNHLDRFLDTFTDEVDKNMFQLLAMTCLYLSIKLNEYKHLLIPESKSSMDTILRLSRGAFTLPQMEQMEYEVLQRLRWHVHPPTPQLFVKHFLFFLSVDEHEIHDLTQFMIELSVMDYFFVNYKPSEVAVASLLNSLQRLYPQSQAQCHLSLLSQFLDLNSEGVVACRERLSLIYAQANDQGVYVSGTTTGKESASSGMGEESSLHRTTSPVSVMAAPQPYDPNHYNPSQFEEVDRMDTDNPVAQDDDL